MRVKNLNQHILWVAVSSASVLLAACGGSGGGHSSTPTASTATGTANVQLTDGPSDNFKRVWVTVKEIAFHTDPNATWSASDATWIKFPLKQGPVTIELNDLNNGKLDALFNGLSLPVGSYKQIRLLFDSADDTLDSSAQATTDTNGAALQWNDQVEYTDSSNNILEAPLEIAYPRQGIQLVGSFDVTATKPVNIAIDFDLDKIIVPFRHDGMDAFTMRPILRYYDLDNAGAISGKIDTTNLCNSTTTTNCAYNLVVKAERLSPDGSRHYDARATMVKSDGTFTLFPLVATDSSGNAITYDVLIRGRQMDTNLITAVPVTLGGVPGAGETQLQSSGSIPITLNTAEYDAQFNSALSPLTSGYAIFQQTLPASAQANAVPYEIRWNNTNPFTGLLFNNLASNGGEALSTGPVHLAAYASGATLNFNAVTPVEGSGGYSVATNETAYYNLSSAAIVTAPGSGTTQTFTPPTPTINSGIQAGTISGTISVGANANYDHGQLVVVHFANIVTTDETDVDNALTNNGGTFTIAGVPAGSAANPVAGAYYYAYLRVWKACTTGACTALKYRKPLIIPIDGMIDLRKTNAVSGINVTIP